MRKIAVACISLSYLLSTSLRVSALPASSSIRSLGLSSRQYFPCFAPPASSSVGSSSSRRQFHTPPQLNALRGGAMPDVCPTIISAAWLKDNLSSVKVLDASWYLFPIMERSPGVPFNAHEDFSKRRIPGALFFDIDEISDKSNPQPHMMPSAAQFSESVSKLGISTDSHVVVYDGKGQFSSARAWRMFKAYGHAKVSILDGGFPAWEACDGAPLDTTSIPPTAAASTPGDYKCELVQGSILNMAQVEANVESGEVQMVDARPRPRFMGDAPEPRPIESGHIANTLSVPWGDLLKPDSTFKSPEEIRMVLQANKVDISKKIAVTCGSGVSACVLAAALELVGVVDAPLYDGAYTEWKTSGKPTYKGTEKTVY